MLIVIKPLLLLGLIILVGVAGVVIVRKKLPLAFLEQHHEIAGYFLGVLSIIYGVLLAFVVYVVWEEFETAQNNVALEVNHVADFDHLAGAFSPKIYEQLHAMNLQYCHLVIDEEWPAMAEGRISKNTLKQLSQIWKVCLKLEPQTPREQIIYQDLLDRLGNMGDQRRLRLHSAENAIPSLMWVLLIIGGVINIAFTFFFGVRYLLSQCVMTSALITLIAFILYLIYALDSPFTGVIAISEKPFVEVTERIKQYPAQDPGTEIKVVGKYIQSRR